MARQIIPSIAKSEKEIVITDIVKSAEKEKKKLKVRIDGEIDDWVIGWIAKRGHTVSAKEADLLIIVDQPVDSEMLGNARKSSKYLAIIYPSKDLKNLPMGLSDGIGGFVGDEVIEKAEVKDFFFGLWNVAYFGFKEPQRPGLAFSAMFVFLALIVLFIYPSFPSDDLLRHMKAHDYGYDYSNLYAYSWNFSFDPYLLFDIFAGNVDQAFHTFGLKLMQAICLIAFAAAFFMNTKDWDDRFRIFVLGLVLLTIGLRITLARPASFEAALFILGLALSGAPAVILGIFMGVLYFLFPIYLIPLALVKKEYWISVAVSIAIWFLFAGQAYFLDIYELFIKIATNRAYPILENLSIIYMLGNPAFLILLYLFIRNRNYKFILPLALFILVNQVRYIDVIAPLLAVSLNERKSGFSSIKFGLLESVFFLLIAFTSLHFVFPGYQLENISLNNVTVLCDGPQCMYNTVYTSSNIRISPSMEIGLTDLAVQKASAQMYYNGTLNCSIFKDYRFDRVVESTLSEVPRCLQLMDVQGKYRIWKVNQSYG